MAAMQKITPVLWYDDAAEEAVRLYADLFADGRVLDVKRYPEQAPGLAGKVMNGSFEIGGLRLMAFDAGPQFKFTPAQSLFVDCKDAAEVDRLYAALVEGGTVLMPLDKYPWSERYAWIADRWGLSWQLNAAPTHTTRVRPAFLFVGDQHGNAEPAMRTYAKLFPASEVGQIERYAPGEPGAEGAVKYAEFTLAGVEMRAMENNAEHAFTFNEAFSLLVDCETQQEVDRYWNALVEGGEAQPCGWLKDRYGVSWQVIPQALPRLLTDPDPEKAARVMEAMLAMKKIDVAGLERAYETTTARR
jgi:predicted 3-demethylubiquinone-9 3-methyltransferase (glyoxalase superfamily)